MSSTAKGMVREAIERLPDDAADRGDVVSHEDAAQLLFKNTPARSE